MSKSPFKICFLADSHGLFDDRIYWKEALSLHKHGYEVHYILAGDENESGVTPDGIHYYKLKKEKYITNRYLNYLLKRLLPGGFYGNMLKRAEAISADVYHIHDLKVNRIGKSLKGLPHKPKVVYDIHEPYPENIIDYFSGPDILKPFIKWYSGYIRVWEKNCARAYDLIITTEENMQQRFKNYFPEKPVEIIYNYTNLPLTSTNQEYDEKTYDAIYTGGITKRRGAMKILQAVRTLKKDHPAFNMLFLGTWFPADLKNEMQEFVVKNKLEKNVEMIDSVPFNEVTEYYLKSRIGLGIFLPIPTHRIILQIKIFEYMNFGLPIVGSNFGHIAKIINKHHCGITVDPDDPESIANAFNTLLTNRELLDRLSSNGIKAARKYYRWDKMEEKLVSIYRKLLD